MEVVEELAGVVVGVLVSGDWPDDVTAIFCIQIVVFINPLNFVLTTCNKVGMCGVNRWFYGES